ncbi:tRNA-dihydrouridine(47) synthase [NAD(P)(+)]-like [Dorcoceras hygrometricum]|uniref:tRNA-dihydrouridine(47) synthase [NAD(P)(+)]-like n=1 Tax=Dorcoceras hygrometricum TaxID=472368 RepID=A0A2Z7BM84_9LAMI|nr:tRNA-dihydrouridine(47) synthase [NAD(P)(+)]-like [Dorcoceras hygrometricum]
MTAFRLVGATSFGCCVWYQLVDFVSVSAGCSADVDVNAGQLSFSSKRMRRRFVVATGSPAATDVDVNAGQLSFSSKRMRRRFVVATGSPAARRAAIPHSHLPAGIIATMRRVVKYHSSWARQQQVELFDASGNPGSTAGRGFNPAGGAPGGGYLVAHVEISRCVSVFALRIKTTAFRLVGATSFGCCVWYQLVDFVCVSAGCSADVDVNAGQLSCISKRMRRRFVVATGSPAASFYQSLREFSQGNLGSTAGRGFNPAGGAPGGG